MSKQIEAMNLGIEALENAKELIALVQEFAIQIGIPGKKVRLGETLIFDRAIFSLKEAIAEHPSQQEPVAWGNLANWCLDSDRVLITDKDDAAKYHRDVYDLTPLYAAPPLQPMTNERYEALVDDLEYWSRYVEVDSAHQALEAHVRQVLTDHGIKP